VHDLSYVPTNPAAWQCLSEFGAIPMYFPDVDQSMVATEARRWVKSVQASGSPNAVFIDTTMLHSANRLLRGEDLLPPTPAGLLDLAHVVSSLIMADTVFYLENKHTDGVALNELLGVGPAFIPVPTESWGSAVGALLRGMWLQCAQYVERMSRGGGRFAEDASRVQAGWNSLVGAPIDWSGWGDAAVDYRNRAYGEASDPPALYDMASDLFRYGGDIAPLPDTGPGSRVGDFILESNIRSAFNYAVAYALGVDYVPNAFRLPYQAFLWERGLAARQHFLQFVDAKAGQAAAEIYGSSEKMEVPLFLAAILAKASSLNDLRGLIAEWRARAGGFRARRTEMNQAIAARDFKLGRGLLKALAVEDSPSLVGMMKAYWAVAGVSALSTIATIVGASAIETAPTGVLHALSIAAEVTVPPALAMTYEGVTGLFRPRTRLIARAASAASEIGNARARIATIWGAPPMRGTEVDWLNRAAAIGR
jgi:hypothetical protein